MGGVLLNSDDVPTLRDMVKDHKRKNKSGTQQRKRWGGGGLKIKQAVISEKGNYNVHKILFKTPVFTGDLTTEPDETIIGETEAFVGEEFDYRIEVGDPVRVVKVDSNWWIVDAQQACRGYCIDDPPDQDYVYGWKLNAPPLSCCPEASGTHVLTTSDSGATYESSTFQCNGAGDSKKWIFNGTRLYISEMLDGGNVEYRTDQTVANCSIELLRFESSIFPEASDCGKKQESVCLHPLCGITTCTYCGDDAPLHWKASFGTSSTTVSGYATNCTMDNPTILEYEDIGENLSPCTWKSLNNSDNYSMTLINTATPYLRVGSTGGLYYLGAGETFDCFGANVFEYDSHSVAQCENFPATITITPYGNETIEGNCNQLIRAVIHEDNSTGTPEVCFHRPYYNYIEVSGVTDNACSDCNKFNGTFTLAYVSKFVSRSEYTANSCGFGNNWAWEIGMPRDSGANTSGVSLKAVGLGGDVFAEYLYSNPDSDFTSANCLRGPVVCDYVTDDGECQTWPASITIYPAIA